MTTDDSIKTARDGVALVGEILKAAGDNPNVKEAGQNLGQTALTITKTINNAIASRRGQFRLRQGSGLFLGKVSAGHFRKDLDYPA